MKASGVCYMLAVLIALVVLVYGFMDLLRKPASDENTSGEVLSRQLRGLGMVLLAPFVLAIGTSLCMGKFGVPALAGVVSA